MLKKNTSYIFLTEKKYEILVIPKHAEIRFSYLKECGYQ